MSLLKIILSLNPNYVWKYIIKFKILDLVKKGKSSNEGKSQNKGKSSNEEKSADKGKSSDGEKSADEGKSQNKGKSSNEKKSEVGEKKFR